MGGLQRACAALACALSLTAPAGCGSDGDDNGGAPAPPYVRPTPIAGCESLSHSACDILDAGCQAQWAAVVDCLRGSPPGEPAPVRILTEAAYEAELRQGAGAPSPELVVAEKALSYLGLVEAGAFTGEQSFGDRVANTGAYYEAESKGITIIDHGLPADGPYVNSILAHELVHAGQDRDINLVAYHEGHVKDFDSFLATRSITEGEAELYQLHVLGALNGIEVAAVDLPAVFERRANRLLEGALSEESPYASASFYFPYGPGANYVYRAFAAGGSGGVLALFASPPLTTRQILLGDAFVEPAPVDFGPAPAVAGYALSSEDRLGAFGLALFGRLSSRGVAASLFQPFRRDLLRIYSDPSGRVGASWQIAFASPADADTFVAMASSKQAPLGLRRTVRDAQGHPALLAAADSATLDALEAALRPPAPPPTPPPAPPPPAVARAFELASRGRPAAPCWLPRFEDLPGGARGR